MPSPGRSSAGTPIDLDPLTGELVRLRELREDDLLTLARWWVDQSVAVYQTTAATTPRSADALAEMFRGWSKNEGTDLGLSVTDRTDGQLVGHVGMFGATPKDRCAEVGIVIGPEHQDRGFGTDTLRLLLRYGFTELNLHRIQLTANSFNARALATYSKVGFVEEGRRREAFFRSGQWYDIVLMGILRAEWEASATGA